MIISSFEKKLRVRIYPIARRQNPMNYTSILKLHDVCFSYFLDVKNIRITGYKI